MAIGKDVKGLIEEVVFTREGDVLVAAVLCELDHHTAKRVRERIDGELFRTRAECLTIDFSSVNFMDSSGIGLILGRVELAAARGATVRLRGLSPTLMKLVRLSGIERIKNLTVSKTLERK